MASALKSRRFTNVVRYLLDNWLPPALREFRPLSKLLALLFHGRHFDLDFKRKAFAMSDEEFARAYARLGKGQKEAYRTTDMTEGQIRWMVEHALGPEVLEVGCGYGELVRRRMQEAGVALDLQVADVERLPFADKSFDTTLCAHTLEHVRNFEK